MKRLFWMCSVLAMACGETGLNRPAEAWTIKEAAPEVTETVDDSHDEDPATPRTPVDPIDPGEVPITETSWSTCALEHYTPSTDPVWFEPRFSGFVPNGGLFTTADGYDGSGVSIRVSDGAPVGAFVTPGLLAMDASWTTGIVGRQWHETSLWNVSNDSRVPIAMPENQWAQAADITEDGSLAVLLSCGEGGAVLSLLATATGVSRRVSLHNDSHCPGYSGAPAQVRLTHDERFAVVLTSAPTIWAVDVTTAAVHTLEAFPKDSSEFPDAVSLGLAVHPSANQIAVTGGDGTLRRWSVPDFEPIGEDISVGAFRINQSTYAPQYIVSPVAWTPDGASLVYVNTDGDTVVHGEEVQVFPSPAFEEDRIGPTPDIPTAFAFHPSTSRLGVRYYRGVGIYGCPGAALPLGGEITVEAPSELTSKLYESTPLSFSVTGAAPLHAVSLTIDGERWEHAQAHEGFELYFSELGDHEVVVGVDDGTASGSATLRVHVTE